MGYTNEELEKVKKCELYLLENIDNVCKKNNIEYFIAYGTALGSRRHDGFIPWDDDIDIHMTRENYNKFLQVAQKNFSSDIFVQNYKTDPYTPWLYTKIRLKGTKFVEYFNRKSKLENGIYIDVFPLDCVPNNIDEYKEVSKKFQRVHKIYSYRVNGHCISESKNIKDYIKKIVKMTLHIVLSVLPKSFYYKKYERLLNDNTYKTDKYGFWFEHRLFLFDSSILFPTINGKFENKEYPIPNDIDKYLKLVYGDYMKLPPKEERIGHKPYIFDLGKYKDR